jgi:fucokinase
LSPQDVVRNWYARNPQIVRTVDALVSLASEIASAFINDNMEKVGRTYLPSLKLFTA